MLKSRHIILDTGSTFGSGATSSPFGSTTFGSKPASGFGTGTGFGTPTNQTGGMFGGGSTNAFGTTTSGFGSTNTGKGKIT